MHVTFRLLEDITSGFSENYKLGAGGYGVVYKVYSSSSFIFPNNTITATAYVGF